MALFGGLAGGIACSIYAPPGENMDGAAGQIGASGSSPGGMKATDGGAPSGAGAGGVGGGSGGSGIDALTNGGSESGHGGMSGSSGQSPAEGATGGTGHAGSIGVAGRDTNGPTSAGAGGAFETDSGGMGGAGGAGGEGAAGGVPSTVELGGASNTAGAGGEAGAGSTPETGHRYVKLLATSEQNGNVWTSVAELLVTTTGGKTLSRQGWSILADSEAISPELSPAVSAIDGNAATYWHSYWQPQRTNDAPLPHYLIVDLGAALPITGFSYLPRQDRSNGRIKDWEFYVSDDGVDWGLPIQSGTFPDGTALQTITF